MNGQNGNGQPNIIVINSGGNKKRNRGGNLRPQFDVDLDGGEIISWAIWKNFIFSDEDEEC